MPLEDLPIVPILWRHEGIGAFPTFFSTPHGHRAQLMILQYWRTSVACIYSLTSEDHSGVKFTNPNASSKEAATASALEPAASRGLRMTLRGRLGVNNLFRLENKTVAVGFTPTISKMIDLCQGLLNWSCVTDAAGV